jgi:CheY-like chemotaxis protein
MHSMLDRLTREHTNVDVLPAAGALPVKADRSQIEQVIMNLVVNARDAMSDGGTIRIATARRQISEQRASASGEMQPGEHACLKVSDTGHGMDEETLARAVEPFFSTREQGTGLGLATVYGIVQQCGGDIEIESQPGEGTTVTVCLPLTEEPLPEVTEPAAAEEERMEAAAARVLLAEDEDQVRGLVKTVLESEGYEVIAAESGEKAQELFEAAHEPIDVLLTDVVMGGIGGVELARLLREDRPDLPVLFMSGYTELELPEGAQLLQKPFMPDELLAALRKELE